LDGDEIGKWVSGEKTPPFSSQLADYQDGSNTQRLGSKPYFEKPGLSDFLKAQRPLSPSYHLQFSEALSNFALLCARPTVEAFDGRLIYAGGDDVLALLPADTVLACAEALRFAFTGREVRALSGEVLMHSPAPGFLSSDRWKDEHGRGRPIPFLVPGPAADASVGIAIAHFKSPLQDVVRAAQDAEKRAKKQLGRGAVAVTLFKRSGETIEWGCKWAGGGLELYRAIADALNAKKLSAKFPYRAAELLLPYLTETSQLVRESQSLAAVEGFDKELREIVRREFGTALSQQTPLKGDEKKALTDAVARKLEAYLQHLEERFSDAVSKFEKRSSDSEAKPWERPRKPDFICGALIGLCQTVAFANRTREESADPQSALRNPQSV
jgi:hypothetical protein